MKRSNDKQMEKNNSKRREQRLTVAITIMAMISVFLFFPASSMADRRAEGSHRDPHHGVEKEKFVIDLGNTTFRGRDQNGSTLLLKRMLKEQHPWVAITDYRLKKVVVVAKTKYGRGKIQLRVGPEYSDRYRVSGRPQDFQSYHRHTYDRVHIHSPFHDSWGPWQLKLDGHFKVRKVVLVVEKRKPHHYGWHYDHKPRHHYKDNRFWSGVYHFDFRW